MESQLSGEGPGTFPSQAEGPSTRGTARVKRGMAEMLKGGVIMDVVTPEQARIAEGAGAVAVMALERVPADIRAQGPPLSFRAEHLKPALDVRAEQVIVILFLIRLRGPRVGRIRRGAREMARRPAAPDARGRPRRRFGLWLRPSHLQILLRAGLCGRRV